MTKQEMFAALKEAGLVAVVRADSAEKAVKIADALVAGGVTALEITYTVPGAGEVIRQLAARFAGTDVLVGAGTVLTAAQAEEAADNGAGFLVSPCLVREVMEVAARRGLAAMPGAMTVREVVDCLACGAQVVKIFPADLFGPAILKDIHGPLPGVELMPTGGVTADNVGEWIKAGAVCVGVGGKLTAGAGTGDWAAVTATAKLFSDNVKKAREELK